MQFSVATWNTQGSPLTNEDKNATLRSLVDLYDVVLLQECGNLAKCNTYEGRRLVSWIPGGALNGRCSTAIISRGYDESGNSGHMHTGRAGIWIRVGRVYVATIHCTSNGKAADQTQMMKEMSTTAGDNPLIIGGDFNCSQDPGELNVGTSSRPIVFSVDTQDRATQQSGNTLDYFVSVNIELKGIRKYRTSSSDHDAVTALYEYY